MHACTIACTRPILNLLIVNLPSTWYHRRLPTNTKQAIRILELSIFEQGELINWRYYVYLEYRIHLIAIGAVLHYLYLLHAFVRLRNECVCGGGGGGRKD